MISEDWRIALYPLGFLASFCFGIRLIQQWMQSERAGKSVVDASFWRWSLCGNSILYSHALIQLQMNVALVQAINACLAWRNLQLHKGSPRKQTRNTIKTLICAIVITCIAFSMQNAECLRSPTAPWQAMASLSLSSTWHCIGTLGLCLSAGRFWVQWWQAENGQSSQLSREFWWMSLAGSTLCVLYFFRMGDLVNTLGFGTPMIPYLRNLLLLKKQKPQEA